MSEEIRLLLRVLNKLDYVFIHYRESGYWYLIAKPVYFIDKPGKNSSGLERYHIYLERNYVTYYRGDRNIFILTNELMDTYGITYHDILEEVFIENIGNV